MIADLHPLMGWAAAIPAIIGLAGQYLNSRRNRGKPPENADYNWIQQNGPGMWNKLGTEARGLIDNPYGLGTDIRNRMYNTARDTAESGYGAALRASDRTAALSGTSPSGGDATRRQYYAGQQMAEGLNKAYSGIDIQDYLAKEDQKNRGYNLLFSLSNKSPIYSQIASQNYWNALQASNEASSQWGSLLGGAASNLTQWGLDRYGQQPSQTQTPGYDTGYYHSGNYDPNAGYNSGYGHEPSDYTSQGYQGYQGPGGGY